MDIPSRIPALSIRQPWAQLIVSGIKDLRRAHFRSLPRGAYVGKVMLDVFKRTPNAPDTYTFHLNHARRYTEPVVGRGQRGLFDLDTTEWDSMKGKMEAYLQRT